MTFLKNNKSSFILLGSMLLGGFVGSLWGPGAAILNPVSDVFLNLLYCCVVPMIFCSLVSAIAGMDGLKEMGRVLVIMLVAFLIAQIIASLYMGVICGIFDPAKGTTLPVTEKIDNMASSTNFLSMFTVSDFSLLWSRKNLMALIVFTILTGVGLLSLGERGKALTELFDQATATVMNVVKYVMFIAPIGLFALFANLIGTYGGELTGSLARAIVIYLAAVIVYYFLSNTAFAYLGGGKNGVKVYYRECLTPTLVSLGTCSSAASIPSNLEACEKAGISPQVRDLCVPLGANLHKDGACLITILKIAFMCSIYKVPFLEPKTFITAIITSTLASMVMGAIPAGGYVGELFIISAFHFPPESIPIMVLIGTITDSPATCVNVTGDFSISMIVERIVNGKNWMMGNSKQNGTERS